MLLSDTQTKLHGTPGNENPGQEKRRATQLVDLHGEDSLRGRRGVHAVCLALGRSEIGTLGGRGRWLEAFWGP